MTETFFHGGKGGMEKGQLILPPSITGAKCSADYGNTVTERDQVYMTTDFTFAAMCASVVKNGDVYEVGPCGEITADPDCFKEGISFQCDRAKILKRIKLSRNEKQHYLLMLELTNEW